MSPSPLLESAPATSLEWMERHLRCLYTHDASDRIVRTREPAGRPAPRFHLGRTRLGNLWRFGAELGSQTLLHLARLSGREPPVRDGAAVPEPPERLEPIRRVLREEREILREWSGPAYRFPAALQDLPGVPSDAVVDITPGREDLLEREFSSEIPHLALRKPCMGYVLSGQAVALCYSARPLSVEGAADSVAAEAGVETAEAHRGHGYGPAAVLAWARAVRVLGGEPLYSTSWTNTASRAVARKLGLVLYGEDRHFS